MVPVRLPRARRSAVMTSVEEALDDYREGRFVIITDDTDRENEGDLTMAAQFVEAKHVNFMARFARGLVCMPMAAEMVDRIGLPMSHSSGTDPYSTPFTVPVEARLGTTTGISAADRARTVEVLLDPECVLADLIMPGHLFPLRARPGGVLERRGQTEAVVDLCRLAGLRPAGILCEIMRIDGLMARLPDLRRFGRRHDVRIISVAEIAEYRKGLGHTI